MDLFTSATSPHQYRFPTPERDNSVYGRLAVNIHLQENYMLLSCAMRIPQNSNGRSYLETAS